MPEIILCNQSTSLKNALNQSHSPENNLHGLSCLNPDTLNSHTPYSITKHLTGMDRDIMCQLSPMPVSRELTRLSLSLGEDNTLALADITAKLQELNIGMMGATTSIYANRVGGFAGEVKKYQQSLMSFRQAVKTNPASRAAAKQNVMSAYQQMQKRFHLELNAVTAGVKSRRGTPLSNPQRGVNIARSSRNVAKLDVTSRIEAHKLVKFSQHAKLLGNGLAVIDFGSRVGNIHNSYKAGDNWERDLFIESSSFAISAGAGALAVNTGGALLSFLVVATPIGWVGLIVGGIAVAGGSVAISMKVNTDIKQNSGNWYDLIMNQLN